MEYKFLLFSEKQSKKIISKEDNYAENINTMPCDTLFQENVGKKENTYKPLQMTNKNNFEDYFKLSQTKIFKKTNYDAKQREAINEYQYSNIKTTLHKFLEDEKTVNKRTKEKNDELLQPKNNESYADSFVSLDAEFLDNRKTFTKITDRYMHRYTKNEDSDKVYIMTILEETKILKNKKVTQQNKTNAIKCCLQLRNRDNSKNETKILGGNEALKWEKKVLETFLPTSYFTEEKIDMNVSQIPSAPASTYESTNKNKDPFFKKILFEKRNKLDLEINQFLLPDSSISTIKISEIKERNKQKNNKKQCNKKEHDIFSDLLRMQKYELDRELGDYLTSKESDSSVSEDHQLSDFTSISKAYWKIQQNTYPVRNVNSKYPNQEVKQSGYFSDFLLENLLKKENKNIKNSEIYLISRNLTRNKVEKKFLSFCYSQPELKTSNIQFESLMTSESTGLNSIQDCSKLRLAHDLQLRLNRIDKGFGDSKILNFTTLNIKCNLCSKFELTHELQIEPDMNESGDLKIKLKKNNDKFGDSIIFDCTGFNCLMVNKCLIFGLAQELQLKPSMGVICFTSAKKKHAITLHQFEELNLNNKDEIEQTKFNYESFILVQSDFSIEPKNMSFSYKTDHKNNIDKKRSIQKQNDQVFFEVRKTDTIIKICTEGLPSLNLYEPQVENWAEKIQQMVLCDTKYLTQGERISNVMDEYSTSFPRLTFKSTDNVHSSLDRKVKTGCKIYMFGEGHKIHKIGYQNEKSYYFNPKISINCSSLVPIRMVLNPNPQNYIHWSLVKQSNNLQSSNLPKLNSLQYEMFTDNLQQMLNDRDYYELFPKVLKSNVSFETCICWPSLKYANCLKVSKQRNTNYKCSINELLLFPKVKHSQQYNAIEFDLLQTFNENVTRLRPAVWKILKNGYFNNKKSMTLFTRKIKLANKDNQRMEEIESVLFPDFNQLLKRSRGFCYNNQIFSNINICENYTYLIAIQAKINQIEFSNDAGNSLKWKNGQENYTKEELETYMKINIDNSNSYIKFDLKSITDNSIQNFSIFPEQYKQNNYLNSTQERDINDKRDKNESNIVNDIKNISFNSIDQYKEGNYLSLQQEVSNIIEEEKKELNIDEKMYSSSIQEIHEKKERTEDPTDLLCALFSTLCSTDTAVKNAHRKTKKNFFEIKEFNSIAESVTYKAKSSRDTLAKNKNKKIPLRKSMKHTRIRSRIHPRKKSGSHSKAKSIILSPKLKFFQNTTQKNCTTVLESSSTNYDEKTTEELNFPEKSRQIFFSEEFEEQILSFSKMSTKACNKQEFLPEEIKKQNLLEEKYVTINGIKHQSFIKQLTRQRLLDNTEFETINSELQSTSKLFNLNQGGDSEKVAESNTLFILKYTLNLVETRIKDLEQTLKRK